MKVARVNGPPIAIMDSATGLGGANPIPDLSELPDVDTGGLSDGDVLVWDAGTSTWVPAPGGGDPADADQVWLPLTTVVDGEPVLVWDGDDSLIPTLVPF